MLALIPIILLTATPAHENDKQNRETVAKWMNIRAVAGCVEQGKFRYDYDNTVMYEPSPCERQYEERQVSEEIIRKFAPKK